VPGVDEHIWHHVSTRPVEAGGRGPKELTGMVDLTRDAQGRVHARLLDLVPGRSGRAYADWLAARTEAFRAGVKVVTLDPFHGYNNAIGDQLEDATAVLDASYADVLVPMSSGSGLTGAAGASDGDDDTRARRVLEGPAEQFGEPSSRIGDLQGGQACSDRVGDLGVVGIAVGVNADDGIDDSCQNWHWLSPSKRWRSSVRHRLEGPG
jgi:hypothetical protein